ncbi:aldo/keto reductase [Streptomyces sp. PTM05]|uniref:Aldo/keto reductase n=1 Tax=Streptantibioticus parmotrematis TaxID=2873249 RepID=A0ABS7QYY3_9ACTN|nr:aldo/keto reductase [Streptantibioticus parmotrematis]MBY8888427.1 aldo/keto reductase [Streptantibioticus parmotrematis]
MPEETPAGTPEGTSTARVGGTVDVGGLALTRVGFGAMQLERLEGDRDAAVALLRRAVELGVNHVDTAQFYGNGFVNEVIRDAFGDDDGVTVVSKVGATPDPGGRIPLRLAQRPEELRAGVEDNLRSLGLDRIPVVNLRRADSGPGLRAEGDQVVGLDDQLAVMTALRDEGKIGAIGLSAVSLETVRRALPVGVVCVQNSYSLVSRQDEELLRLCVEQGIAWVPFFPLGGSFPGLPKVTDTPEVLEAAKSLDVSPAQIGLAWLLHHTPNTILIPGTADPAHLEANVAVGSLRLDAATLRSLDAVESRTGDIVLD